MVVIFSWHIHLLSLAADACVAASYVGGNCYMKSVLNSGSENVNVIGVSVTTRESTGGSTPATPQTCPSNYSCPENNGCTFKGADLRPFTLSCGVDFYGGDLSSQYAQNYQTCTQACADNHDCVAASFTGGKGDGDCYLKSKNNGGTINSNINAVFHDTQVAPSPTPSASSIIALSTSIMSSSATSDVSVSSTIISSSVTVSSSSLVSSTPEVSSTSIISSTSTTPTVTPTPTPLAPGPNVLLNSGFETNGGSTVRVISDWTLVNTVYPVVQSRYAHGGNSYVVMNPRIGSNAELSQTVNSLDTNRLYQFSFWLTPYTTFAANVASCQLDILANDNVVYTKVFGAADAIGTAVAVRYSQYTTSPFPITSAQQTMKFRYQCSFVNSQTSGSSPYIIVDDANLNAA